MRPSLLAPLALSSAALGACSARAAEDPPPIFEGLSYADALERATAREKWLVVDVYASWCAPCRAMDASSWRDAELEAWLRRNAIAIRLDVGAERAEPSPPEIAALPTVVALRDGREVDRIVGGRDGGELLDWLRGLERGETFLQQTRRRLTAMRASEPEAGSPEDFEVRARLARELVSLGESEDSTSACVWLWRHRPNDGGASRTALVASLRTLAGRSEAAREQLEELRREAFARDAAAPDDPERIRDALALNAALGDRAATVRWALGMTDTPEHVALLRELDDELFELLADANAWDVAGLALADPAARVEALGSAITEPERAGSSERDSSRDAVTEHAAILLRVDGTRLRPARGKKAAAGEATRRLEHFRVAAARIHAACLAAQRDDDARRVAAALFRYADDGEARRLAVETALQAGAARAEQAPWLERAEEQGADVRELRERLEQALQR